MCTSSDRGSVLADPSAVRAEPPPQAIVALDDETSLQSQPSPSRPGKKFLAAPLISCVARSVSPIFLSKRNLRLGATSGVHKRFRRAEPELLTAGHPGGISGVVVGLGL